MENSRTQKDTGDMPYTNREIDEWRTDVKQDLQNILIQTTAHNGRMSKIEGKWMYLTGATSVLTMLVVPLLGWAIYTLANLNHIIQETVKDALSVYDLDIK